MSKITKCIIPAAGFGTRFLPATKAQPKEMLPIVDKPVIQYLVEEAAAAGITDIIIVTGRGKRSIEDHFDHSFELTTTLVEKGKTRELQEVERISRLANIAYVRQPIPRGDGDALMRAWRYIGGEPCLVLFGDDLVKGEVSAASQLIRTFDETGAPVVALERIPDHLVSQYGIVETDTQQGRIHRITKFLEKPKLEETASRLGVIGKFVLTPDIFETLGDLTAQNTGNEEVRLADAFTAVVGHRYVYGLEVEGARYDTGSKLGFLKATVDYALERGDIGEEFLKFLKERLR